MNHSRPVVLLASAVLLVACGGDGETADQAASSTSGSTSGTTGSTASSGASTTSTAASSGAGGGGAAGGAGGAGAAGGSGGQGGGGGGGGGSSGDDPFSLDHHGYVIIVEAQGASYAGAVMYDAPFEQPPPVQEASMGDCAVWKRPPQCPGPCTMANVVSAGDITITGLNVPVTLTYMNGVYSAPPDLPEDLFADDAAIQVSAAGATIPAFTADVQGVPPLGGATFLIEAHDDVDETITWTPAAPDAGIFVALRLGWHGAPWPASIVCQPADTGSVTVPGGMFNELPYFNGMGLFQHVSYIRRLHRRVVKVGTGTIEVVVASEQMVGLTHEP